MIKLPPHADSILTTQLAGIQDELRDIKRVHAQGQEEDLRMALSRTITRVEDLSAMLIEQYKAQTEIQTELTLCKSNLQLALANNEMLEDALKRDTSGRAKDVGWRRQPPPGVENDRSSKSFDAEQPPPSSIDSSTVLPLTPDANTNTESRFFKFRFGGGNGRTTPQPSPTLQNGVYPSHLSSASLPSLVPSKDKELEELTSELDRERKARKGIVDEKQKLEEELESLSQALFEEANNMVATERMKLADAEAELQEVRDEKEALRNALRLIEDENGRYRQILSASSPSRSRSHSRANTLPSGGPFPTSRPSSPLPRSRSALSNKSFTASPSSSQSSSPDPSYATPIEYDSGELSPWAGVKSAGTTPTPTPTSTFLQPPRSSSLIPPRSLPPPLNVPPWSAASFAPSPLLTPNSSLPPHKSPAHPSREGSLLAVPGSVSTIVSNPPVVLSPIPLSMDEAKNDIPTPAS